MAESFPELKKLSSDSRITKASKTVCAHAKLLQLCPALCYPMDYSSPGSSVHGIFLARILEWVAISSSRGSSQPRDRTQVSCLSGRFFTIEPPGKLPSLSKNWDLEILAITFFFFLFVVDTCCLWLWTFLPMGLPGKDLHTVQKGLQGGCKSSHGGNLLSGSRYRLHL